MPCNYWIFVKSHREIAEITTTERCSEGNLTTVSCNHCSVSADLTAKNAYFHVDSLTRVVDRSHCSIKIRPCTAAASNGPSMGPIRRYSLSSHLKVSTLLYLTALTAQTTKYLSLSACRCSLAAIRFKNRTENSSLSQTQSPSLETHPGTCRSFVRSLELQKSAIESGKRQRRSSIDGSWLL